MTGERMPDESARRPAARSSAPLRSDARAESRIADAPDAPATEAPSDDVVATPGATVLPGEHRGGFQRALTQPTPITQSVHTSVEWAPAPEVLPRSGAWSLGLAIVALGLSLVVGWAFPLGLASIVLAILALRRPWESRSVAVWALVLGAVSIIYSAGWLVWAAFRAGLLA